MGELTDKFNTEARLAYQEFQFSVGAKPDGVPGPKSWEAAVIGISALQSFMTEVANKTGDQRINPKGIDGDPGHKTMTAVEHFKDWAAENPGQMSPMMEGVLKAIQNPDVMAIHRAKAEELLIHGDNTAHYRKVQVDAISTGRDMGERWHTNMTDYGQQQRTDADAQVIFAADDKPPYESELPPTSPWHAEPVQPKDWPENKGRPKGDYDADPEGHWEPDYKPFFCHAVGEGVICSPTPGINGNVDSPSILATENPSAILNKLIENEDLTVQELFDRLQDDTPLTIDTLVQEKGYDSIEDLMKSPSPSDDNGLHEIKHEQPDQQQSFPAGPGGSITC